MLDGLRSVGGLWCGRSMKTYITMLAVACAVLVSEAQAKSGVEVVKATIFAYKGDRHAGGNGRCVGRPVDPKEYGLAHRTLPCGTLVKVTNLRTHKSTHARVVDRGPYGSCLDEGWTRGPCENWQIKRKRSDPGVWRGGADLTPAVATAIGHKSFDRVKLEVVPER